MDPNTHCKTLPQSAVGKLLKQIPITTTTAMSARGRAAVAEAEQSTYIYNRIKIIAMKIKQRTKINGKHFACWPVCMAEEKERAECVSE